MATQFIAYHTKTNDLALFNSDGQYWIGSYSPFCTHQNAEPPYILIEGYFTSEHDGLAALHKLTGNEF